ncbi:MAG: peptidylprolyl isomerase [Clostridiaceae bacterium]|nr:peptidylprolyl isomerase [Clostridiaceae bacterium]MDD6274166.1 peptidylprolyl isomerase [Clostridiaceae bacterium]
MKSLRRAAALFLCLALCAVLFSACSAGIHHAEIVVEGYGSIFVELDGKTAPKTVRNFMKLAKEGFYDGLTFHRLAQDFVIQGGDPNGDGTGGSSETIEGEFAANGHRNSISHRRGVISMARGDGFEGAYDSASSQFFICVEDATALNGLYAAFGHVTEGMDVVDAMMADAAEKGINGRAPVEDQPVITTIKILD